MKSFKISLVAYFLILYLNYCVSEFQSILTALSEKTLAEDGKLNFTQLATKYGHSAEQYEVITDDGYILTIFRLPGRKPPVLLLHGLADIGDTYILRGETSLAITLVKEGYDVWVGNNRGNKYGHRHVSLDPATDDQFWDYTFHEIGCYDHAAIIDFIRKNTGQDSIAVISQSQGTTAQYALAATRPEYNSRIKVAITMAPIVFLNHLIPPVSIGTLAGPAILDVLKSLGIVKLFQDQKAASDLIKFICSKGIVSYAVCALGFLFPIFGFDPKRIEPEFLNVIAGHYPAGTSRKSLEHFDQIALRGSFSQYDYGKTDNLVEYGTENPPDYNLSAVCMNVALLVGSNDQLSRVEDVQYLRYHLPNVIHCEVMKPKLWMHLDFLWASDMPKYLYPSIFKILEKYN